MEEKKIVRVIESENTALYWKIIFEPEYKFVRLGEGRRSKMVGVYECDGVEYHMSVK